MRVNAAYTCTVELLLKDTLIKGLLYKTDAPTYLVAIHFTSERGQLLYNGQNGPSQCVHYLDIPLYHICACIILCTMSCVGRQKGNQPGPRSTEDEETLCFVRTTGEV